jgi:K(+)-stimulated pyrophosphate-energized sodium pump
MVIAGLGVLFSIIGTFFVKINKDSDSVMNAH